MADDEIGDGFAALFGRIFFHDVGAHRPQHMQQSGSARIEADRAQSQLRTRHQRRRDDEERGRGEIGRHPYIGRAQAMAAGHHGLARAEHNWVSKGREHALGVVAGRMWFAYPGFAIRVQACEQQC